MARVRPHPRQWMLSSSVQMHSVGPVWQKGKKAHAPSRVTGNATARSNRVHALSGGFDCSTEWPRRSTLLPPIFRLRGLVRLPLHVARIVSPTTLERHDVVNDVARAGT